MLRSKCEGVNREEGSVWECAGELAFSHKLREHLWHQGRHREGSAGK